MAGSATKKAAAPKKRSTAKTWKRSSGEDLALPSGNVALVKRPGMLEFIKKGVVPDTLLPTVDEAIKKGKGLPPSETENLLKDPSKIAAMEEMMNKVVVLCVVEPEVRLHTDDDGDVIPEADRDEDVIYTDDVDLEDKIFIFQFASGGTRDVERFRQESGIGLGGVHASEDDGGSSE
jgi:hypothetical protein